MYLGDHCQTHSARIAPLRFLQAVHTRIFSQLAITETQLQNPSHAAAIISCMPRRCAPLPHIAAASKLLRAHRERAGMCDGRLVRELLRRGLVGDELREYASVLVRRSNTRRRAAKAGGAGLAGLSVPFIAAAALPLAGFMASGVAVGSLAAAFQTPAIAAGSWFAVAQSSAASGALWATATAGGGVTSVAATALQAVWNGEAEPRTDCELFALVLTRNLVDDNLREMIRRSGGGGKL
jgi:hypothetical protein